ncbi:glutathione S-transferase family protein [Pseudomonas aeruginosa]
MKLFYAPGTCAVACWIALEWVGTQYDLINVDYTSKEFQQVNPLMLVPALDTGGGQVLTQASAILIYISEQYPLASIGCGDSVEARSKFNEVMSFLSSDFHPSFWPFFSPQRFTVNESSEALEDVVGAAHVRINRVMTHLDQLVGEEGYLYLGRRSVADAYAYVMIRWTERLPKKWREYPNIARFYSLMEKDPIVKKVIQLSNA